MSTTATSPASEQAELVDGPVRIDGYADDWPRPRPRHRARNALIRGAAVGFVVFVSLVLAIINPWFAMAPAIAVLCGWAVMTLPFGLVTALVVGLLLSINSPGLRPGDGHSRSILTPVGTILFTITPLKLAVADMLVGLLVLRAIMIYRIRRRNRDNDRRPAPQYVQAVFIAGGAIMAWTVFGIGTGGNFKQMLWQVRPLMWMPCFAFAAAVAAGTPRGIARLRNAILFAGVAKAVQGIVFYFTVAKPQHLDVAYVTTHSDSVLWSVATAIVFSDWIEARTRRTRRNLVTLFPLYALGMVLNNRRTVWVSVFASIAFLMLVAHRPVKRQLARVLGVTWPLLVLYVAAGLGSHSPSIVFKPVSMINSVMFQRDASSSTRDIENYNLIITLKARPLIGWGFGHEYIEASRAYDISKEFPQYRYIPHNSFLGLWAFLGPFGAGGYFLLPTVAVFFAVATRRRSRNAALRSAGAWAVCAAIAYLIQGWADMGLQDWTAILCAGVGFGIAGALPGLVAREERASLAGRAGPTPGAADVPALVVVAMVSGGSGPIRAVGELG